MRTLFAAALALALVPWLAAQSSPEGPRAVTSRGQGYTYFGVTNGTGDFPDGMTLGGGGEGFLSGGLAAGADAAYLFANGRFGSGIGLASANLSYHFRGLDPDGRWVPFVTGGYTLAFRDGAGSLVNYGAGMTYWARPHIGVRVEFRNHQNGHISIPGVRFGLSFR